MKSYLFAIALGTALASVALLTQHLRPAHASCDDRPGAAYIGERPFYPPQGPTTCITSGNVTLCQ